MVEDGRWESRLGGRSLCDGEREGGEVAGAKRERSGVDWWKMGGDRG